MDKWQSRDTVLRKAGVEHKLIPPRTPWHNGKVERSHRKRSAILRNRQPHPNVDSALKKR